MFESGVLDGLMDKYPPYHHVHALALAAKYGDLSAWLYLKDAMIEVGYIPN